MEVTSDAILVGGRGYDSKVTTGKKRGETGKRSPAIEAWNDFCKTHKGLPGFDGNSVEQAADAELWDTFASWLMTQYRTPQGDPLMMGTQLNWLSDIIEEHRYKFRGVALGKSFFVDGVQWYSDIRQALKERCTKEGFEDGIAVENRSQPISRWQMRNIVEAHIAENKPENILRAATLTTNWNAIGRTGEAAFCSFNDHSFYDDQHEMLTFDWNQSKNGRSDPMNFTHDYEFMELDFYFVFAIYAIALGGALLTNNAPRFLFPRLANMESKNSATGFICSSFAWSVKKLKMNLELTPTSMRVGSFNHMVGHPGLKIEYAILRGGWEMSKFCKAWWYIVAFLVWIAMAARALAGWPSPELGVYRARLLRVLDNLSPAQQQALRNYMMMLMPVYNLFQMYYADELLEYFFSALLLYWNRFVAKYGHNHIIYKAMFAVAAQNPMWHELITDANLTTWSNLVKDDFDARNAAAVPVGPEGTATALQSLQSQVNGLRDQLAEMLSLTRSMATVQAARLPAVAATVSPTATPAQLMELAAPPSSPSTAAAAAAAAAAPAPLVHAGALAMAVVRERAAVAEQEKLTEASAMEAAKLRQAKDASSIDIDRANLDMATALTDCSRHRFYVTNKQQTASVTYKGDASKERHFNRSMVHMLTFLKPAERLIYDQAWPSADSPKWQAHYKTVSNLGVVVQNRQMVQLWTDEYNMFGTCGEAGAQIQKDLTKKKTAWEAAAGKKKPKDKDKDKEVTVDTAYYGSKKPFYSGISARLSSLNKGVVKDREQLFGKGEPSKRQRTEKAAAEPAAGIDGDDMDTADSTTAAAAAALDPHPDLSRRQETQSTLQKMATGISGWLLPKTGSN